MIEVALVGEVEKQQILNIAEKGIAEIKNHLRGSVGEMTVEAWQASENAPLIDLFNRLVAVEAIFQYEQVNIVSSSRGIDNFRDESGKILELQPSGRESMKMLLYSGMDSYMEDIPGQDIYLNRSSRFDIAKKKSCH